VLFTTKHHDGFCMFDSALSEYKITAPECPYAQAPNADIAKALFEACRAEGLAVSAYFSKPDWHSDFYWRREFKIGETRNVNYDVREHPELWTDFVKYTHGQLRELTSNYGKIDVLWLDGGWVRPDNLGQDIRLGEVAEEIRATTQPHLIVCDRTVGGECEDIVTPEVAVPDSPLGIPWEACVPLGKYFSFHYEDDFKPAGEVIKLLLKIVSNGGSLALNVTPRPDGAIPPKALAILSRLGRWLETHGDGIYGSDSAYIPAQDNVFYTRKDGATYAYVTYGEAPRLPLRLFLRRPGEVPSVRLLRTGQEIPFSIKGDWLIADTSGVSMQGAEYADCFVLR
jgi:alpha-L-fucosidase